MVVDSLESWKGTSEREELIKASSCFLIYKKAENFEDLQYREIHPSVKGIKE